MLHVVGRRTWTHHRTVSLDKTTQLGRITGEFIRQTSSNFPGRISSSLARARSTVTAAVSHDGGGEDESDEDNELPQSNRDEIEDPVRDPWQSRKCSSWLGDQLYNARVNGSQSGGAFLPGYKLNEIIIAEAVKRELTESGLDLPEADLTRIAESVCHLPKSGSGSGQSRPVAFRKIFVILVLIGESPSIIDFIKHKVSDRDLPLTIKLSDDGAGRADPTLLSCVAGWNNGVIELFHTFQWVVLTPFFNNNENNGKIFHYKLNPKHLVTEAEDWESVPSGFSHVRRVKLLDEADNCSLENSLETEQFFALKKFTSGDKRSFEHEVETLKLVSQIQDPHLIKLLVSFEYNGNRHLLFPWADGGSLRDLWRKHADPDRLGENLAEWVIQQCQGIASALAHIHDPGNYLSQKPELFGRHGDLKPENILSFKGDSETHELGVLKIADFGLAEWSATSQAKPMGSKIRLSPTYRAPEVDVENGVMSRRYDIWTLGCLYLEFVTWYLMGWDAVEHMFPAVRVAGDPDWKSVKEDKFFRIETNGQDGSKGEHTVIVKPEVTKWIADLHKHPRSTPVIHDFLDLIETSMLRVRIEDRAQSSVVASTLKTMLDQCREEPPYATKAIPSTETVDSSSMLKQDVGISSQDLHGGIKDLRLIPCGSPSIPSVLDRWRILVENWLGDGEVDWYPLPPVNRMQSPTQARLAWKYGGRELSIILNEDETRRCRGKIREVAKSLLPLHGQRGTGHNTWTLNPWGLAKLFQFWTWKSQKSNRTDKQQDDPNMPGESQPPASAENRTWKESYLCFDKAWMATKKPCLTIIAVDGILDDCDFFLQARKVLRDARGGWLQNLISWKSVNKVELSQFFFLFDNNDLVSVIAAKPSEDLCPGYEWANESPSPPRDVHMRIIGEMILAGLQAPHLGRGKKTVLSGIPKRPAPPALERKALRSIWGFHAGQGLSVRRIIYWANGLVVLGLAFVPIWLGVINKLDLTNAFTPVTFLFALIMLWLSIAALDHAL